MNDFSKFLTAIVLAYVLFPGLETTDILSNPVWYGFRLALSLSVFIPAFWLMDDDFAGKVLTLVTVNIIGFGIHLHPIWTVASEVTVVKSMMVPYFLTILAIILTIVLFERWNEQRLWGKTVKVSV